MDKYKAIFRMSLASELVYKTNFIIWRVRNILSLIVVFYLWNTVFSDAGKVVFGYDKTKMLTYIFLILVVKAFVLTSKSTDVAGEIGRGDLSNYLVKPVNYFKFWFTKDISYKVLNISFAAVEFIILFYLLKPELFLQTSIFYLTGFIFSILIALLIYFFLIMIVSAIPFWAPELGWGSHFLITVIFVEFLSGALFPLDIFPQVVQKILLLTPFPYLLYFPVQIYLGKLDFASTVIGILISLFWVFILNILLKTLWTKGLKIYQAYGR